MTTHDKGVLRTARSLLKQGAVKLEIGNRVVARKKILAQLIKEFPRKKIGIEGNVDILSYGTK